MTAYQLAQVNIGRMRGSIDSETMAGFVARLDEINALADEAEGFIWRLQSDEGDATSIRVYDDALIIVNMSVWDSIESLHNYTYKSTHVELIRDRKEWFSQMEKPHMVLWWIQAGHIPSTEEAKAKLDYLHEHGVSPLAFSFAKRFTIEAMLAAQANSVR